MIKNKVGVIFLVSILTLAGIGISYAGFTDTIYVYGEVDTATVDIDWIGWYSGTWVFKIWGFEETPDKIPPYFDNVELYDLDDEILIYNGFENNFQGQNNLETSVISWAEDHNGQAELVSSAYAGPGGMHPDPTGVDKQYDVDMTYDNLFPCIDFCADFIFHYDGSIPAKIDVADIFTFDTWLKELWNMYQKQPNEGFGAWVEAYRAYPHIVNGGPITGWTIDYDDPVDVGYQLHQCYYVYVKLCIHLPQDNIYQGLSGKFFGKIGVKQWNDQCQEQVDLPPVVEITDITFDVGEAYIEAVATDDYGIVSTGWRWEYNGGMQAASGTVVPPELMQIIATMINPVTGPNKIIMYAFDTAGQYGEDVADILITEVIQ